MASDGKPNLSILIPVYNSEAVIGSLIDQLCNLDLDAPYEIVLVNDGSIDDSATVCRRKAADSPIPITVIEHSRNFGEHNAIMTGLRHCAGDYIITMDDDMQNPPSEIKKLYAATRDGGFDVVYTAYAKKRDPLFRNLGSHFANWTANLVMDKPKDLYLSSFRCLTGFVADQVARYEGPYPYIDGLILQVTQRIGSIEVEHLARSHNKSNYTLRRLLRLWLSLVVNFSVFPLRLATLLGFAFASLSAVGGLYVLIDYLAFGEPVKGWVSLVLTVLLFSGVQLLMLGIMGEYVGRQYLAINRKPQAIVRSVFTRDNASSSD